MTTKLIDNDWVCTCPTLNRHEGVYTCSLCGTVYDVEDALEGLRWLSKGGGPPTDYPMLYDEEGRV